MLRRLGIGVAFAACVGVVSAEPAPARSSVIPTPGAARPRITVRVYDGTGLSDRVRREAMKGSRRLLDAAGLDPRFHDCSPASTSSTEVCATSVEAGNLIVRMVQSRDKATPATRHVLGFATIDAASRRGTMATVFTNRIAALSALARVPIETVLSRTIAHEIGHLLLGTNEHGALGLMREVWTIDELANSRKEHWSFTAAELARIHGAA